MSQEILEPEIKKQDNLLRSNSRVKQNGKRRKISLITLSIIFIVLGLIYFFYWLIWSRYEVYTDDAYVNGNLISLMSQIPGTVIEITTDDTLLVKKGQVLIKLDSADMEIAFENARASLAETVRRVKQYYENAEQAKSALVVRQADLLKAQLDLKRRIGLLRELAISKEELQHYQTNLAIAKAAFNSALYQAQAAFSLVENFHLYTHPLVESAKVNFKKAFLDLKRTTILAPITGYIAKRSVQVGQTISVNMPLLAIVPLEEAWVDANYKESQLSALRIGQPVKLYADAYSDVTYHGKVMGLNAGTGAAFALLPSQNASGNWIKIVQRLPVRISLDHEELKKNPLQIGLSMRVTIDIHHVNGKPLTSTPSNQPLYTTNIYANQLAEANQLINEILQKTSPDIFLPLLSVATSKHS